MLRRHWPGTSFDVPARGDCWEGHVSPLCFWSPCPSGSEGKANSLSTGRTLSSAARRLRAQATVSAGLDSPTLPFTLTALTASSTFVV